MKKLFLSYLFICATTVAFTQTTNLKSKVIEKGSSTAVVGAIVAINGTSLAETTNSEGDFIINNIPLGEQIVTVTKKGYKTKIFLLNIEKGFLFKIDKIEVEITKKIKKEREKLEKQKEKEREEKLKKVKKETKKAEKEREKLEKELAKQQEKDIKKKIKENKKREKEIRDLAKKDSGVKIEYQPIPKPDDNQTVSIEDADVNIVEPVSEIQLKYAKILGIEPSDIDNKALYEFIDTWTGITYLSGGETKDGIDCSSFTQRLFTKVYDKYIERTAKKQFDSRFNDEFSDRKHLAEGDLVFFHAYKNPAVISHVGVYLQNNKFVHSTSSKAKTGLNGVQISDLSDPKWSVRFSAGGKRLSSDN